MRYIFFWVPTIKPIHTFNPRKFEISDNISDHDLPFHLAITLDKDLNLTIKSNDISFSFSPIGLRFIESHACGMLCYAFNEEEDIILTDHAFDKQIYHMVKELYHKHEYHAIDEDSILSAFISDEIDFKYAIQNYCDKFQEKFCAHAEDISDQLERIESSQKNPNNLDLCIKSLFVGNKKITKALGELIYYQHLSSYLHPDNSENRYESVERLREDFSTKQLKIVYNLNHLQYIISQSQVYLSLVLAVVSIALGLVSIYVTFFPPTR
jgi:hypothetical protein